MNRLTEIDGLRAIAVLGVLWSHFWMFFGNPFLNVFGLPINRILSFGGVGVDLFFVISGFCMYYTFHNKYSTLTIPIFWKFLKGRWLRVAPLYYLAVIVYSIFIYINTVHFPFKSVIYHLFFLQTIFNSNNIAPHFWSLATEWHFYLILPFFFYFGYINRHNNYFIFKLIFLCILCRLFYWGFIANSPLTIDRSDRIYLRFVEFGWGIFICQLFILNIPLSKLFSGISGFIFAFGIAFLGRLLNTTEVILAFSHLGYIVKALADPIMSFGFSMLILNILKSKTFFSKILNSSIFQQIGKVSYSFYLWHWMVSIYICKIALIYFGQKNLVLNIAFIISALITFLISKLSWSLIESRYFKINSIKINV